MDKQDKGTWVWIAVIAAVLLFRWYGGGLVDSIAQPQKVSAVTYIFEKNDGGIPSGVTAAIAKLNERGIMATTFEDDTTDTGGDVPEQYKVALAESKKQGTPLLVVQAGDVIIRTVKAPTTEMQVLEAVP